MGEGTFHLLPGPRLSSLIVLDLNKASGWRQKEGGLYRQEGVYSDLDETVQLSGAGSRAGGTHLDT